MHLGHIFSHEVVYETRLAVLSFTIQVLMKIMFVMNSFSAASIMSLSSCPW